MNQLEATSTIIDFVREQHPEEKFVLRALKVLERRHEVLRTRWERKFVKVPEDLMSEPSAIPYEDILSDLHGTVCRNCTGKKKSQESFCRECYNKLDAPMRKALYMRWNTGYIFAFCRGVRLLKEMGGLAA